MPEAKFAVLGVCVCFTSGERRVQLLVEEPVLPVLLLLSDIALSWLDVAQQGARFSSTLILQTEACLGYACSTFCDIKRCQKTRVS